MAYAALKLTKPGLKESQEAIYSIRIAMSSKNVENLDKGPSIGPTPPRISHPIFEKPTWVVEEFHGHRLGYGAIIGIAVAATVFILALAWGLRKLFFSTTVATSSTPSPPVQHIWIPPTWTVVAPLTIAFQPDGTPIIAEIEHRNTD